MSILGCAPRCNFLLRFAARIIMRYFESTSCPPLPSTSLPSNSVVTPLLLLLLSPHNWIAFEFFNPFQPHALLAHATSALRINDRRKLAHRPVNLVINDYVIESRVLLQLLWRVAQAQLEFLG